MSTYNIIVNNVQESENEVVCLARIDNYRNMLKHVSVGEYITTSEAIHINFHNSIGASKWVLIFYPKGQYIPSGNSTIFGSGRASMYLKMISCENKDSSLRTTVKIFIKSPYYEIEDKFACKKYANFLYRDLDKRWVGPFDLVSLNELYSKNCENFFLNDCLTIGCELVYTSSSRVTRSQEHKNTEIRKINADVTRKSLTIKEHQIIDLVEDRKDPRYVRSSSVLQNYGQDEVKDKGQKDKALINESRRASNKKISNYCFTGNNKEEDKDKETWHRKKNAAVLTHVERQTTGYVEKRKSAPVYRRSSTVLQNRMESEDKAKETGHRKIIAEAPTHVEFETTDVEKRKNAPVYRRSSLVLQNSMIQKYETPIHESHRKSSKKISNDNFCLNEGKGKKTGHRKVNAEALPYVERQTTDCVEKRKNASVSRRSSVVLQNSMDQKDETHIPESHRKSNFGPDVNKDKETWHQILLKICNKNMETRNNENNPPNRRLNATSNELATSKPALEVLNDNYGCSVKDNIELFEKLSTTRG